MTRGVTLVLLVGLAACTVGPDFTPPKPPDIRSWNDPSARGTDANARVSPASDPDPQWWDGFNDPVLSQLEKQAISGNLDLQQAVLRVVAARQNEAAARAAGLPTLGGTGSYTRQQIGAKGVLQSSGALGQLNSLADQNSALNQFSPGLGNRVSSAGQGAVNRIIQPIDLYQYGLDAS